MTDTSAVYDGEQVTEPKFAPHWRRSPLDRLAWDSLRLLLALAETGSFRSAAAASGVALNTMRSKIDRLESQFGTLLFIRSVEGCRLTQEGHELVSIARQMQALGQSARRVRDPIPNRAPSRVRLTVTEGLGTFWLVPRLVEFCSAHPAIGIDLHCDMTTPDVLFRDTDIAVQWRRPAGPGMIAERIASVHVMPFATDAYFARKGRPASIAEAGAHELVWQRAEPVADDALDSLLGAGAARPVVSFTTNTSSAHYWAVAQGAGIGFLPTYAAAFDATLRPIDLGVHLKRDVFLVHHPLAAKRPDVRRAIDWLRDTFSSNRFPWFADDFVHPDSFAAALTPNDLALFAALRPL